MKNNPKVSFHTLGCRLNFSETSEIADGFIHRGFEVVPFEKNADVVFINTCTVTDGADAGCRNIIRKAKKNSPQAKIVVSGCYAQMNPDEIKKLPVDIILGSNEKFDVFKHMDNFQGEQIVETHLGQEFKSASSHQSDSSHTRAFLKVQDGCNYICSFCIIPFARGRSRTITIKQAKKEAISLVQEGFKEIILTGVNVGEYEKSSGEKLSDLVREITQIEGLQRFRLSSIEPNTIQVDLLEELKRSGKCQQHFHIPLQSGSDEILSSMRRKYLSRQYLEKIQLVQKYFPLSSFGADVMVGYPGETDEHFEETYQLIKNSALTHLHVFPFSVRQGTMAQKMPGQVPAPVKKERVKKLIALGEKKLQNYAKKLIGETRDVLFESFKNGKWQGYTSEFITTTIHSESNLKNKIIRVKLNSYNDNGFQAEILQ
jgi:threonylcarbamoyladenosine tRNA methylthiotransferase MtaB